MYMWASLLLVLLLTPTVESAETPHIPTTNEVARYERLKPVFRSKHIPREHGDALLALLDGGRATDRWMKNGLPPGFVCALPLPAHLWITITLTNGSTHRMGFSQEGEVIYLREGLYELNDVVSKPVARLMAELDADLRREIVSAPRPCVYQVGTTEDASTLSGIARLFYGDASKWTHIYEANRAVLKSPHQLSGAERLTIPKL
jgi:hypothetical protein